MGSIGDKIGKAGLALAGFAFHIAFYICMAVLIFWAGRQTYQFGYQVFNQQAMNPGEGQEVQVTVPAGMDDYNIGKLLEQNGLISDARVFFVQEYLYGYHGKLQSGTYSLSTAYTPARLMSILAGDEEEEGSSA